MKKADFEKHSKKVERILLDNNFNRTIEGDYYHPQYEWKKETKFGLFFCNPDTDYKSKIISIFCRFQDVEKSRPIHGNTFTGKINIHKLTSDEVIMELNWLLKRIDGLN